MGLWLVSPYLRTRQPRAARRGGHEPTSAPPRLRGKARPAISVELRISNVGAERLSLAVVREEPVIGVVVVVELKPVVESRQERFE